MFIKRITKSDRKGEKTYVYYRLVHGYKIGNKSIQQTLINIGSLDGLPNESHKLLADRIESLLTGLNPMLFDVSAEIE